jgi:hypothetical protein
VPGNPRSGGRAGTLVNDDETLARTKCKRGGLEAGS